MKKIMGFLLSVCMIFSMTACGGEGSDSSRPSPSPAAKNETEEPAQEVSEQPEEVQTEEPAASPAAEAEIEPSTTEGKTLVVYYSATGSTKKVADYIAKATGAEVFELEPVDQYSDEDLDWTDDDSRVVDEHEHPEKRKVELAASKVSDWESYDTVYIGYPKL